MPRILLDELGQDGAPERILVEIGRASKRMPRIGCRVEIALLSVADACEFDYSEGKVNSKKYELFHDGRRYPLYVPNEVFASKRPRSRRYVRITLAEQGTAAAELR